MKKILVIFILCLAPMFAQAQSVFDAFEDVEDVTSIVVSKKMFSLIAKMSTGDSEDAKNLREMSESLTGLKMFATDNPEVAKKMKSKVASYLKSASLEELMRIKEEDATIKFYVREGRDEDHVKELLMFVSEGNINIKGEDIESVVLTLTGDIDLNKIHYLTEQYNLPKELNEVNKKKNN
ncbi:MAG: DUF4252 domain-containing protein [Flavobacteriaceae bacterium]|nr:DUF4252 domain-containing protein [Flavobacteriaceae bacterium]